MKYRENIDVTKRYKKEYIDGINRIIEQRQKEAETVRCEYIKGIFENQDKYRNDFKKMLGWPLIDHSDKKIPEVTCEKLSAEEGYTIFRMQFEILDGLKMTGLFFKACDDEKKPLVIVQHGGIGTPELISGVYDDTDNYNDMLHRVRKYGVHVFAPQLLLWDKKYNVEYNRETVDSRLKRVGSSITAVEIYGIMRVLDYFETQAYTSSFGMVGLSYGGFYTLYTAAVDTRIKSAISCSFFNMEDARRRSDWEWYKSAYRFDDAEVACLVYPRKLCIETGEQDATFDYRFSLKSFERVKQISQNITGNWIDLVLFDGIHEFCKDDKPIQKLIDDLK